MKRCLRCDETFGGANWRCPACGHQPDSFAGVPVFAPGLIDGDGRDADYPFDVLVAAEARHFWFRTRARVIASAFGAHFPGAQSFLEIGAGAGGVLLELRRRFPATRLVGSELLARGVSEAKRRLAGIELLQMDARRIPFVSEFDVIGAFDVLEHIDEDEAVLAQMRDALRPKGGVILTVPQHPWLWSQFDEFSCHRRRYRRRDLVAKLARAGFRVLRATSFTSFALPLMFASRIGRRRNDLPKDLEVPEVVNRALLGVGSIERALIDAGVSLPVGGSLLAVGVRTT